MSSRWLLLSKRLSWKLKSLGDGPEAVGRRVREVGLAEVHAHDVVDAEADRGEYGLVAGSERKAARAGRRIAAGLPYAVDAEPDETRRQIERDADHAAAHVRAARGAVAGARADRAAHAVAGAGRDAVADAEVERRAHRQHADRGQARARLRRNLPVPAAGGHAD